MAVPPPPPRPRPEHAHWHDDILEHLAWYAQRKPVFTGGNQVQLLKGGNALFEDMARAMDAAQQSIWLAMYLVLPRGKPQAVLDALVRAAQRGVAVHMVIDAVGSNDAPESTWKRLKEAGVQLVRFRPVRKLWGLGDPGAWRRMHMKLCVVDDAVGFVGGINLLDDWLDARHGRLDAPRLDYALSVRGPVVMPIRHTTQAVWTRAQWGEDWRDELSQLAQSETRLARLRAVWQTARWRLAPHEQAPLAKAVARQDPTRCAFVLRDNLRQRSTIERAALQAIQRAKHRIDIVTPYFYPRRAMRLALGQAAQRGVHVRILLQGHRVDFKIAALAARVLYEELQAQGVHIHEYQAAQLHAKVMRVDENWATVGSSNLDPLSFVLNLEANLIVRDHGFVQTLSGVLDDDFAHSREVPRQAMQANTWGVRLQRRFVAWLTRAYMRLAGAAGRY